MKLFPLSWLHLTNDIHDIDHETVKRKLAENTQFSFSILMLLITSTLICTLGLLIDSPSVVIGGMLISPLMWPLIKISLGISLGSSRSLKQAGILLLLSVLISLASSFLIAYLSPIKVVNTEILARTQPTLLDLFVALAAGAIATLGVVQKRISDSLAGVAIAVALLPPLCVSGIGLALGSISIFSGSLLLFFANGISIIFASLLVFMLIGLRKKSDTRLQKEGLILVALTLFLTAIPLFILLRDYSFQTTTYKKVETILQQSLTELSPDNTIENITVDTSSNKKSKRIKITADILLSGISSLSYKDQQLMIKRLESELGMTIDLRFRIQQTVAVASEEDEYEATTTREARKIIESFIKEKKKTYVIHSLKVIGGNGRAVTISLILRGNPQDRITEKEKQELEGELKKHLTSNIHLTLEILAGYTPLTESELEEGVITNRLRSLLRKVYPQAEVVDISLTTLPLSQLHGDALKQKTTVTISLQVPSNFRATKVQLTDIADILQEEFGREFLLILQTVERKTFTN